MGVMDPSTKLILEKMEAFKADLEQQLRDSDLKHDACFKVLEPVIESLGTWKPKMEEEVDNLKFAISRLTKEVDRVVFEKAPSVPGLLVKPGAATAASSASSAGDPAIGPFGHRVDH